MGNSLFRPKKMDHRRSLPATFSYQYILENVINQNISPNCSIAGRYYEIIAANSFIKLRSQEGISYLVNSAPSQRSGKSPDWKLHFSIAYSDLANAWDILAALFLEKQCPSLMKVIMHSQENWPDYMQGREITIYIPIPMLSDVDYWHQLIHEAEGRLKEAQIKQQACAIGDLSLGSIPVFAMKLL